MSLLKSNDALKAFAKEIVIETVPIAEYNKVLQRLEQLENKILALEQTNSILAEAVKGIKPLQKPSFID